MDKLTPRVGIGVFIFKNGKFLMGSRKGAHGEGTWSIPGGHLDYGESIEEGAQREAHEETGITIEKVNIAGITNDIFSKEKKHYVTIWVTSHWKQGHPHITEPDKFIALEWRDFQSLPENLFLPWRQLMKSDFYSAIKKLA